MVIPSLLAINCWMLENVIGSSPLTLMVLINISQKVFAIKCYNSLEVEDGQGSKTPFRRRKKIQASPDIRFYSSIIQRWFLYIMSQYSGLFAQTVIPCYPPDFSRTSPTANNEGRLYKVNKKGLLLKLLLLLLLKLLLLLLHVTVSSVSVCGQAS